MNYLDLCQLYHQLDATTKRLEKTWHISRFLQKAHPDDLPSIILLLQGLIYPEYDERKMGIASRLILKAIQVATGIPAMKVEEMWKATGDLGISAERLVTKKTQSTLASRELTVEKVLTNLRRASELEGEGMVDKKVKLLAELLTSATPIEARYIIRTTLEELRVGVASCTIRDAITWAFFEDACKLNYDEQKKSIEPEDREKYSEIVAIVQTAHDLCNDYAEVARLAKTAGMRGLQDVSLTVGKPIKVMLFQKARGIGEAFERVGKPCAFEYKYDGFRLQIHKQGGRIVLYTRRLEDVTQQFPEVVAYVKTHVHADAVILDGEAVGYHPKTKKYLPFQSISQRIRRKYDIERLSRDFPVELNIFDILSADGNTVMGEPFRKRRERIERMIEQVPYKIIVAKQLVTDDPEKAEAFYKASLDAGEEGVMAKNLEGIYKPGSRVGFGVKIKPTMETLDLAIVGAEWGEGKRKGWLSTFALACRDEDTGEFLELGKVGTGFKELEAEGGITFEQMTKLLEQLIIAEKGKEVTVKPQIVIEVTYEEIQRSPTYTSGYALRFPRLVNLRMEKPADEASTLQIVEELYDNQKQGR